jgi:arylsulfatase A-like enzyme
MPRMKNILPISLFFIATLICGCKQDQTKKQSKNNKLNVLFIIADDLNCDLGIYGNSTVQSPNIDHLGRIGLVFKNVHNQYPLCGPSRASFMTGMYADQTNIISNNVYLRSTVPKVITLGQRFRQQGYQSVRIGKIFHYDNPSSIGTSGCDDIYSWDQTFNPYGRDKKEEYKINTLSPRRYGGTLSWLAAEGKDEEQTDGIGASKAIEYLDEFAKTGESFFLAVGMYRPHTPFVAPRKYFDLYNKEDIEIDESSDEYLATLPVSAAKSVRAKKSQINLDTELAKEIKEAYYATTSFVDAQVGRILNKLKECGLAENTLVVFTSDHGYHLGEHGHWQKQTLFDNATRVPLIFAGAGISDEVGASSQPVELIDIYPTIMEITGIETPEHVVGKSLVPLFISSGNNIRKSALTKWRNGYSIKTERYRITKWKEEDKFSYELYDHKYDKKELNNLNDDNSYVSVFDSLKIQLDKRIADSKLTPPGIGIQRKGVKSLDKAPNITYGDIHDKNGVRTFMKPLFQI